MGTRLKNWELAKQRGRKMRLDAELAAHQSGEPVSTTPPLFSHDPTIQYYFNEALRRVTPCEIHRHLGIAKTSQGNDLLQKIRNFRHEYLEIH